MAGNITAVVVALIGFGGVALGIYFSRKGQKRSEDSQRIAEIFKAQQKLTEDIAHERDAAKHELAQERVRHIEEM
ncbi:MAG TPA: hypothetical protein VFA83_15765, partial [Acidimicrobiales bacterium]|nr:hypothetical protein [Acidimicrobiales bacterium]